VIHAAFLSDARFIGEESDPALKENFGRSNKMSENAFSKSS
jgi:hypothetical protein